MGLEVDCELEFSLDLPEPSTWEGRPVLFPRAQQSEDSAHDEEEEPKINSWRLKERMKTMNVALVACLNIRVDPPDVIKPSPCARMECWVDPQMMSPQKALETIGKKLEAQYRRWQPRANYQQGLDPKVDDVKKLCDNLRKEAKDERVLFHYNGHGVPRPTANSEIWVFNKNFTQYIPLSVYDLQTWLGSPSVFVFDCSNAGVLVNQQHRDADLIILAACSAGELLPQNPELPADVFTSCLTTPITMALRWFCSRSSSLLKIDPSLIDHIPGQLNNRKTILGELNWIFTAVTDTIAWSLLPPELFQRLFRQDLLVASIFRNFILAERILRSVNCNPVSVPKLPPSYQHPLWSAWDLAVEVCLSQLPAVLADPPAEYQPSSFFVEQLTAFEVWLEFGGRKETKPPVLTVVLQVLLSQAHRFRALNLLARFLDMGSWAVNHALSVGVFPYVLKLLQSPSKHIREPLIFIWAKILTVDSSCTVDLIRDTDYTYFLQCLTSPDLPPNQRALSVVILSVIVSELPEAKDKCLQGDIIIGLKGHVDSSCPHIRKWVCLCSGQLWSSYERAKSLALDQQLPQVIVTLLQDPVAEVRAAALYALGTYM
ncbi:hypothetical protein GUITHDRAFT_81643, partial [Guillardia theta CCMP2712]